MIKMRGFVNLMFLAGISTVFALGAMTGDCSGPPNPVPDATPEQCLCPRCPTPGSGGDACCPQGLCFVSAQPLQCVTPEEYCSAQ